MIDAASSLFPSLPTGFALPASPAPVASAPASPTASAPVAPSSAAPAMEESSEQRIERLFGNPDQKPAATADANKPADPAAIDFLDAANPDTAAALPVVQALKLDRAGVEQLQTLHTQMSAAAIDRQSATWATEAKALPQDVIRDAQAAVTQFGSPALNKLLNDSGMGNHPAVIQAFAKALRSNPYRR